MNTDWQSWAALGIVAITAAVFVLRTVKKRKAGGGCGSCGCSMRDRMKPGR